MELFEKYKTNKKVPRYIQCVNSEFKYLGHESIMCDEYSAGIFELMMYLLELKLKLKRYKTIWHIIFNNGNRKAKIIELNIKNLISEIDNKLRLNWSHLS